MIELSSPGDIPKEQSMQVFFHRKIIHDSGCSQQASSSKKMKFEKISVEMIGISQQAGSSQQVSASKTDKIKRKKERIKKKDNIYRIIVQGP